MDQKRNQRNKNTCFVSFKKKITCVFLYFCFLLLFTIKSYSEDNLNLKYKAAIVVDANNGEVLYSYNPDMAIYPASLTKIMTAYIVFSAVEQGVIGINDHISTNNNTTIKNLLYQMAINSHNDATNILAREIYGSTGSFINSMNNVAKKMNMKNTHFANTNGLFNENHYSTVRDIAKASIRLVYDFPQYADIFGITNYIDEDDEYNVKTTTIQQNIKGIEGSKTGYIDASGYNLALWGHYYGKHIFVVISGVNEKVNRDRVAVLLLNKVLKRYKNDFYSGIDINDLLKKRNNDNYFNKVCNFLDINCSQYISPTPKIRRQTINYFNYNK